MFVKSNIFGVRCLWCFQNTDFRQTGLKKDCSGSSPIFPVKRKWLSRNLFGNIILFLILPSIQGSYFLQQQGNQLQYQIAGVGLSGQLNDHFLYHTNLEYNVFRKTVRLFRHLMGYYRGRWQLIVEWNHQTPRIREDSYFQIFQIRGYNQFRSSVGYRWQQWLISLQYLRTWYNSDNTNQWILGCSQRWGYVGFILQNGFGGRNLGVYGDLRYGLTSRLTLRAHSSYYNYQRHTIAIGEEATAYSLGLTYRHGRKLQLDADLQQSQNTYFRNDLRALLRLLYRVDI